MDAIEEEMGQLLLLLSYMVGKFACTCDTQKMTLVQIIN